MDWKIIIPLALIIIGWFTVNWLTAKREFHSKRREVRIKYLIGAYRSIASAANRGEQTSEEQKYQIESAVEDIQLLGNKSQVGALKRMIAQRNNDFTEVLMELRYELRQELGLEEIKEPLKFYRMNRG